MTIMVTCLTSSLGDGFIYMRIRNCLSFLHLSPSESLELVPRNFYIPEALFGQRVTSHNNQMPYLDVGSNVV